MHLNNLQFLRRFERPTYDSGGLEAEPSRNQTVDDH